MRTDEDRLREVMEVDVMLAPTTQWNDDKRRKIIRGILAGKVTARQIMVAHRLTSEDIAAWVRGMQHERIRHHVAKAA